MTETPKAKVIVSVDASEVSLFIAKMKELVEYLKGIYPDVPKEVLDTIRELPRSVVHASHVSQIETGVQKALHRAAPAIISAVSSDAIGSMSSNVQMPKRPN